MNDTLTKNQRSARMALVRGKNTGPEMVVRRMVHGLGYRYRLPATTSPDRARGQPHDIAAQLARPPLQPCDSCHAPRRKVVPVAWIA